MLSELFEQLPEASDMDKPKLVFFFDEAHLLFDNASAALQEKIEQAVRLIRSKGVGIYFVTQNPLDLPESVLGQLGNRVQQAAQAEQEKAQAKEQEALAKQQAREQEHIAEKQQKEAGHEAKQREKLIQATVGDICQERYPQPRRQRRLFYSSFSNSQNFIKSASSADLLNQHSPALKPHSGSHKIGIKILYFLFHKFFMVFMLKIDCKWIL